MPPIALSAFRTTTAADGNVPSVPVSRPFELSDMKYASCYCEENIYCMVRDHVAPERRDEYFVVFISNREKCVALNFQKASPTPGTPVYWDYHVILLHHPASHPHTITVYDLDTALPFGLPWHTYFERTCSAPLAPAPAPAPTIPSYVHDRHYKLVPAADYLRLFSSTRAHMKRVLAGENTWSWVMEPPAWPAIRSEEGGENALERFLDFAHGGDAFGRVYGERGFMAHLLALVGGRG